MFVSMPEYKFYVPPEIAPPEATYWRTLGLSVNAAWFVLSVRAKVPDALLDTFLLVWDRDVVDAIASMDAEVESLLVVAPHVSGRRNGWFSKQIKEIWEGTDLADRDNRCVVMVGEDDVEYAGLFMEEAAAVKRDRLVARVGARPKRKARAMQD